MSVAFVAAEVTGDQVALVGYQRRQDESQFGKRDLDRQVGVFRRPPTRRSLVRRSRQSVGLPVFGSETAPSKTRIWSGNSQ